MPQSGTKVRGDIQGLRALAVGLVVAYHAKVVGIPGGYVGVDVFYVISGFLITGLLLREVERTGTVRLSAFYARRARRLLPAATVVILATLAAAFVLLPPLRLAVIGTDAAAAALYVSNLRFAAQATDYLAAGAAQSPFLHFWSLAVEEQFYLVWPALILLVTRHRGLRGPRRITLLVTVAVMLVFAASLASSIWLTPRLSNWAFYASPPRAFEFAAGALVALAVPRLTRLGRAPATVLALLGVALVATAAARFDETTSFPGTAALLPVLGATLFIIGGSGVAGPLERLWAVPALARLGVLSYSLYLWHWPMLVLPEAVAGRGLTVVERTGLVIAAIVAAELTVRLVEDPARHARALMAPSRGLAFGLALSLVAATVALIGPPYAAEARTRAALAGAQVTGVEVPRDLLPSLVQAADDLPASQHDGCNPEVDSSEPGPCAYGLEASTHTIALFGDSHAAQWLPALDRLGDKQGFRVLAMVKSGCPSATVTVGRMQTTAAYTECDAWRNKAIERITDAKPALVIVSNLQRYLPLDPIADPNQWWGQGLTTTLTQLTPLAPVVVLADTPFPEINVPECLSAHLSDVSACAIPAGVAISNDRRNVEVAAATATGATHLDPSSWVCPDDPCAAVSGRYLVYRDGSHLSTPYVRSLANELATGLAVAARGGVGGSTGSATDPATAADTDPAPIAEPAPAPEPARD
jgi:peptidoglycan/LPS O-acetylase OafA/YrhL